MNLPEEGGRSSLLLESSYSKEYAGKLTLPGANPGRPKLLTCTLKLLT